MGQDYISTTDAGKLTFANNMVDLLTPSPTDWGITAGILTTLSGYVTDYGTKLAAATEPATKSRSNTFAKNTARDLMVQYIRDAIVPAVQGAATVTDQMKYDMGLTVRGANPPTPIGPPTEVPVMKIIAVNGWIIEVQATTADSERRGLPEGVAGVNIYSSTAPTPPADPAEWTFEGESSRSRFKVEAPASLTAGAKFHVTCCFKNPRFQTGPACAAATIIIGGGIPETNVG